MARTTIIELLDDIDGRPAAETVMFSLDGITYEIDLSAQNAAKLRSNFAPFVDKARRAQTSRLKRTGQGSGGGKGSAAGDSRASGSRERSAEIRAWAKEHGIQVNDRGRIPTQVTEAYDAKDVSRVKPAKNIPQVTFQSS